MKKSRVQPYLEEIRDRVFLLLTPKKGGGKMSKFCTGLVVGVSFLVCNLQIISAEVISLQPITVSASSEFKKEEIFDLGYSARTYSRQDIEKTSATTLLDFLKQTPELNISDWYGTGVKANVDLLGFGDNANSNILLLINGRRVNEVDLSGIDWTQIPLGIIDRIEIIKGPGTVLYGDNACGGVINVITRKKVPPQLKTIISTEFGSYSLNKETIEVSSGSEKLNLYLNANHHSTDGYRRNSHYRSQNYYFNINYKIEEDLSAFLESGYHNYWYGLPGALYDYEIGTTYSRRDTKYPWDNALMEDSFVNLGLKKEFSPEFKISWGLNFRNKNGKDNWLSYGNWNFTTDRNIQSLGSRLEVYKLFRIFNKENEILMGIELYRADFSADKDDFSVFNSDDWTDIDRKTKAIFVHNKISVMPNLSLALGARVQREKFEFDYTPLAGSSVDDSLSFTEEAYEACLNYKISETSNIFLNFDRGFRVPKTDEYFSTWATPPVNKSLLPQKNKTIVAGYNAILTPKIKLQSDIFYMKVDNELYYDPLTYENKNYPRVVRKGLNLSLNCQPVNNLNLNFGYRYVSAKFDKGDYNGKKVPAVPNNIFYFHLAYSAFDDKLLIYFDTRYRDKEYLINDMENKVKKLDSFWVSNLKLVYKPKDNLELFGGINNIFNEKYSEYGSTNAAGSVRALYPSPERNYYIGIKVKF